MQARFRGFLARKNVVPKLQAMQRKRNGGRVVSRNNNNENGEQERVYEDGSRYKGNTRLHLGTLRDGVREGYGVQEWTDGGRYEGYWKNDKSWGKGVYKSPNGDVYDGNWENDMANGQGKFTKADGSSYTGDWVNDTQTGKGSPEAPESNCCSI